MIRREPCLGTRGFPGQRIYQKERWLGTITRTSDCGFWWIAEDGKFDPVGKCIKIRSGGRANTAEDAEQALIKVLGITQEEFE